ncbi:MAG: glucuronate isomerase [Planctomycetes bacterium]|nr:glucuronate isomerase [Planctomycetota bacterium]
MGKKRKDAFIGKNFLLQSKVAEELYHEYARDLPIIDYHCHLPPKDVADDRKYRNMSEIWLAGDHYKWRAMRSNGVAERFITGDASDWEKFLAWAETVPKCLRNPLYHWTHLELKRPFRIGDRLLNEDTAASIWEECNERLDEPGYTARGIMEQWQVAVVCTTDDPCDDLAHHKRVARSGWHVQMRPTWRPDKGMMVEDAPAFNAWLNRLGEAVGSEVKDLDGYMNALRKRHDFFHAAGCRLSDHGLETVFAEDCSDNQAKQIFAKARDGKQVSPEEAAAFKSWILVEWGRMDHARGWVQQFHLGPIRNNNTRMFKLLGPDTGFDSIGDASYAKPLSRFLDRLDQTDQLAKTILYNINPKENEVLGTMIGNFQDGSVAGKMQFGSGWWFLDQKDGMEKQMNALSNLGLLSRFVGMLTDSRSFLSYSRHEYFRRTLCNMLGNDVAEGTLPKDVKLLGGMVRDICYGNAATYFDFGLPAQPEEWLSRCEKPGKKKKG